MNERNTRQQLTPREKEVIELARRLPRKGNVPCFSQLSLDDLSPIIPIPEDHCLVILKSYFDGGNEADSTQYDRVTLATVCGNNEQWRAFNVAWKQVLDKHQAPFLHTTDAVSLQGGFSGWDDASVDKFIADCVNTASRHIAIPRGLPNVSARSGLCVVTLSIYLKDFLRARQTNPRLPNTANELCATESLGFAFKWGRHIGAHWYHLYFDQGEPFYGHIYDRRHNKKSKKAIQLMERITHLGESDMRHVPSLQLADLFAWSINHEGSVSREWHSELFKLPWNSVYLDYDLLLKPMNGVLDLIHSWKLPRRRPSK